MNAGRGPGALRWAGAACAGGRLAPRRPSCADINARVVIGLNGECDAHGHGKGDVITRGTEEATRARLLSAGEADVTSTGTRSVQFPFPARPTECTCKRLLAEEGTACQPRVFECLLASSSGGGGTRTASKGPSSMSASHRRTPASDRAATDRAATDHAAFISQTTHSARYSPTDAEVPSASARGSRGAMS